MQRSAAPQTSGANVTTASAGRSALLDNRSRSGMAVSGRQVVGTFGPGGNVASM
jgi:hypothetical protein